MLNRRGFMQGVATSLGAVSVSTSEAAMAAEPTMSLNVIYPNHEGARFDMAYYRGSHIPLAMKVMKAARATLIEGVPTAGAVPPYVMIVHFEFASAEALKAGTDNPAMADVRADVANFTDIKPVVMVGRSS